MSRPASVADTIDPNSERGTPSRVSNATFSSNVSNEGPNTGSFQGAVNTDVPQSPFNDYSGVTQMNRRHSGSGFFPGANIVNANNGDFKKSDGDMTIQQYFAPVNYNTQENRSPETIITKIAAVLKPADRGSHYVPGCMDGTRRHIFKEIESWLTDVKEPNILWLSGSPGAGKSAIASSMVSTLTERGQLGSYFFFRRGHVTLSDPAALWRTVACDMAERNSNFATAVATVLKEKGVDLKKPNISLDFKYLIQGPLIIVDYPTPPVIVIDALDECGSRNSESEVAQRKTLLDTLVQWSSLSKKFKLIILTGRNHHVNIDRHSNHEQAIWSA